jgi:acyl-CoA thioester hydrolase
MSRHVYECFVRFSDVDVYGHVNNVKYFEYYQEARIRFMSELGRDRDEPEFGLVVARLDVDYRRPILFRPEPYFVESWVTRVGTKSFGLASEIRDARSRDGADGRAQGAVLSRARSVLVGFDMLAQRSRPLSEREVKRLSDVLDAG